MEYEQLIVVFVFLLFIYSVVVTGFCWLFYQDKERNNKAWRREVRKNDRLRRDILVSKLLKK